MSVNKVILVGNVGNDPELKKNEAIPTSTVVNFNVATNETHKDKSGSKIKKTEWHRIVAFGRLAETCGEYIKKGKQVYIEGRIQSRTYKDKEDKEQKVYEIIASEVKFIGPNPIVKEASDAKAESPKPVEAAGPEDLLDV